MFVLFAAITLCSCAKEKKVFKVCFVKHFTMEQWQENATMVPSSNPWSWGELYLNNKLFQEAEYPVLLDGLRSSQYYINDMSDHGIDPSSLIITKVVPMGGGYAYHIKGKKWWSKFSHDTYCGTFDPSTSDADAIAVMIQGLANQFDGNVDNLNNYVDTFFVVNMGQREGWE